LGQQVSRPTPVERSGDVETGGFAVANPCYEPGRGLGIR
jgi:hypothetical protein